MVSSSLTDADRRLAIAPAETKEALSPEDVEDWRKGTFSNDALAAFASSQSDPNLAIRKPVTAFRYNLMRFASIAIRPVRAQLQVKVFSSPLMTTTAAGCFRSTPLLGAYLTKVSLSWRDVMPSGTQMPGTALIE